MKGKSELTTRKNTGKDWQFRVGLLGAGLLAIALSGGCSSAPERLPEQSAASRPGPADAWSVTETNPRCPTPAVLWNGLIGLRLGRSGMGLDADGQVLPLFDIDEYDVDGEEKIRALPNPLQFTWSDGSPLFDPRLARDYAQTLDFRTGILTTRWRETHGELGEIQVRSEVVLHPSKRNLAARWTVESTEKAIGHALKFSFEGSRDEPGGSRIRTGGSSYRVLERSTPSPRGLTFEVDLSIGRSPQAQRLIEARQPGDYDWPADFGKPAPILSFDEIASAAKEFHSGAKAPDIEIDGPIEDQQAVRSFLFYLRSSVHPDGQMSVAPMGLSSQTYHGHVFWDADIWVFPALALLEPDRAAAITRYRMRCLPRAEENFMDWLGQGRPTGKGKLGGVDLRAPGTGAKFPWESSVTGRETVPGPSKYEDHISGSVAFASAQAAALGLISESDFRALAERVAGFFRLRTTGKEGEPRRLPGTMSPDENHTGDDDLYTNLLAQWSLSSGRFLNSKPLSGSSRNEGGPSAASRDSGSTPIQIYLPKDGVSFLTYESDPIRSYKQAAAVLAIYPLQFPDAEKQAKAMMERFAGKVSPNGPAMSDSVHALIWARLGEKEKAYEAWRKSWQDFTKHPLLLFSEKRSKENTYFVTGAGGSLQSVLYGFLGLRIDDRTPPGARFIANLENGKVLSGSPSLPPLWKSVRIKNLSVLGKRLEGEAASDGLRFSLR